MCGARWHLDATYRNLWRQYRGDAQCSADSEYGVQAMLEMVDPPRWFHWHLRGKDRSDWWEQVEVEEA